MIEVCHGPRCSEYGGRGILRILKKNDFESHTSPCQSLCPYSPVVRIDGKAIIHATPEMVLEALSDS